MLELNCVPGMRVNDSQSYLAGKWHPSFDGLVPIYPGESDANRDYCWKIVQENVNNSVGIWWSFDGPTGLCDAIVNSTKLLPWPNAFPDYQSSNKMCIMSHLVGKKDLPLIHSI